MTYELRNPIQHIIDKLNQVCPNRFYRSDTRNDSQANLSTYNQLVSGLTQKNRQLESFKSQEAEDRTELMMQMKSDLNLLLNSVD